MKNFVGLVKRSLSRIQSLTVKASERVEIAEVLEELKDSNSLLGIGNNAKKGTDSRASSISAINLKHGVFVIDTLTAKCTKVLIRNESWLHIKTLKNGRILSFKARYLEPFLENQNLGYLFEFPKKIESDQIRASMPFVSKMWAENCL